MTDPEAPEIAQPDTGQDDTGASSSPYAAYLNRLPEEVRGDVEPIFKDWDANVTKRFQEAAEFRKTWEPFADTGIGQLSREQAAWAAQFVGALEDPQVMSQWWEAYARENGLTPATAAPAPAADPAAGLQALDEFGYQDPAQQIEKLLEDKLGPLAQRIEQYGQRFEQQDQAQREAEAGRFIEGQIAELKAKHGDFDSQTEELVNTLAGRYIESDPMNAIPRAFEDLQRWRNDVEKSALQAKVDAPRPAETGGIPDVAPERHTRFDSDGVKNAAIEFLRNSNRA